MLGTLARFARHNPRGGVLMLATAVLMLPAIFSAAQAARSPDVEPARVRTGSPGSQRWDGRVAIAGWDAGPGEESLEV